jgi:putative spermidine/putrescine transport system permease protein
MKRIARSSSNISLTWTFWIPVGATMLFLILPVATIIPMSFSTGRYLEFPPSGFSFQWYRAFFASQDWMASLGVSFQVAILTTLLSISLGVPAAFAIVRGSLPFKRFLLAFFSLPIVFPIIVSAVGLYYVFAPLHLVGTKLGLALAHTILALPVVILPTVATLKRFDERIEWQALNLGATRLQVFRTVTLPLLRPCLITVMLFSFITSFDEVIFAIFLSGGSTITLPKKIWEGLRFEIQPTVTVVATFLLIVSIAIMLSALVIRRKLGFKQSV